MSLDVEIAWRSSSVVFSKVARSACSWRISSCAVSVSKAIVTHHIGSDIQLIGNHDEVVAAAAAESDSPSVVDANVCERTPR